MSNDKENDTNTDDVTISETNITKKEELKDGDARTLIQEMGGIRPLAKKLGLSASTVQGWYERNNIPAKRVETILSMYDESSAKGETINVEETINITEKSDANNKDDDAIKKIDHTSELKSFFNANMAVFLGIIAIIAAVGRPYYAHIIDPYLIEGSHQQPNAAVNTDHQHADMQGLQNHVADIQKDINNINDRLLENDALLNTISASNNSNEQQNIDITPLQQQISQLQQELDIIKNKSISSPAMIQPNIQEFDENKMLEQLREQINSQTNALQEKLSQDFNRIEMQIDQELKTLSRDNNQQALFSLRQEFNENLSLAHHIITTAQLNALFAQPQMMRSALSRLKAQSSQHQELQALIDDAIDLAHRPVYSKAMLHDQMNILIDELRGLPLQNSNAGVMDKLKATLAQIITIRPTNYIDGTNPIDLLAIFNDDKDLQQLMLAGEGFVNIYPPMAQWLKDADFHIKRHQLTQRLSDYMQQLFADNKTS